jgi:uncharacterized coiled-coil protein SlyX
MKSSFFIALFSLFALQLKSQSTGDSIHTENQQLINSLNNRLTAIENIGNGDNPYVNEIKKLKAQVKIQNDSIEELNRLLAQLKKSPFDKKNGGINEMSDKDLNASLNKSSVTSQQLGACNCFRLFYKPYQTELDFNSFSELDSLVNICKNNSRTKLKIVGHADKSGDEKENRVLSEKRVVALKNYLAVKGIASDKIIIEWHGSAMPDVDAKDADKQFLNRRAEVIVLNN